jgi:hypothetical protein
MSGASSTPVGGSAFVPGAGGGGVDPAASIPGTPIGTDGTTTFVDLPGVPGAMPIWASPSIDDSPTMAVPDLGVPPAIAPQAGEPPAVPPLLPPPPPAR